MIIQHLPAGMADMMWEQFKGHLELALIQHPSETVEDLEDLRCRVRSGEAEIIQVFDAMEQLAVALIEFEQFRDGKTLHVRYLQGDRMECWLDMLHARLEEIARLHDCKYISLTGRAGWRKTLRHLGFNPVAIQLRAEVA